MALQHAVLALLANGPSHGYELKSAFEEAVGPQWGTLNVGQLYQVLSRLAADGLITSEREPQATRPDRLVHALTPLGRQTLDEWLQQPTVRQHGYRDDFFLRLMAVGRTGETSAIQAVITRQRDYLMGELHNLARPTGSRNADPISLLVIEAARLHIEADLGVLDRAEQDLAALTQPGRAEATAAD